MMDVDFEYKYLNSKIDESKNVFGLKKIGEILLELKKLFRELENKIPAHYKYFSLAVTHAYYEALNLILLVCLGLKLEAYRTLRYIMEVLCQSLYLELTCDSKGLRGAEREEYISKELARLRRGYRSFSIKMIFNIKWPSKTIRKRILRLYRSLTRSQHPTSIEWIKTHTFNYTWDLHERLSFLLKFNEFLSYLTQVFEV